MTGLQALVIFLVAIPFLYVTGVTLAGWISGEGDSGPLAAIVTVVTCVSLVVFGIEVFS